MYVKKSKSIVKIVSGNETMWKFKNRYALIHFVNLYIKNKKYELEETWVSDDTLLYFHTFCGSYFLYDNTEKYYEDKIININHDRIEPVYYDIVYKDIQSFIEKFESRVLTY